MLRFDRVTKTYADGTVALREVSLEIPKGEFCVLLGPSGAGKTSLLKMANALVVPTDGRVLIEDEVLEKNSLSRLRQKVAMIHQHFNLVERLSVEKNVIAGALPQIPLWRILLHCYPEALRRKAAELVASVGLEHKHFVRRASALSGGQQQRVGIARAFILDPLIVLADEPVASLDPKISHDILKILRKAAREHHATVLCSLHQLELAREFADRIIGMRDGSVVFDGPPENITRDDLIRIYGHLPESETESSEVSETPEAANTHTKTLVEA